MPGARLIVNARYFHIARPGEAASKYALVPEAAASLVNYIATRESVLLNFLAEYEQRPATQKQKDAIERFLESSPDIEKSREYKAYAEHPTGANASRLIARATEYVFGLDEEGDVKATRPATRAQRERIREFVEKVPAIQDTPEYADYLASATRENASEVLSHALETALESAADPETLRIMLNYIAERPGVVRGEVTQHGLFCSDGTADLEAEKDAIAAHKGNIYSFVFSLRRTDADALGYDGQEKWRDLFVKKQIDLAKELHVPLKELHWIAAVHNTRHHPHAHFIAYSNAQTTRMYLSQNAIDAIKSDFVSEIFRDERYNLFAPREEIRQALSDRLERLLTQLDQNAGAELSALQIPQRLSELKEAVLASKGRHVYKFLPQNVKAMADRLLDGLSTVPEIKELLTEYGKYQKELESYYQMHPDEPQPLSAAAARSNLYMLKNLVIRCALQADTLDLDAGDVKTGSTSGFFDFPAETTPPQIADIPPAEGSHDLTAEQKRHTRRIDSVREYRPSGGNMKTEPPKEPAADSSPEELFRYAQFLRYEENRPEDAVLWYNLADQRGHAEAAYQLAQHYLRHPAEQDLRLGNEYLLTAKLRFENLLLDSNNAFLIQDINTGASYQAAVSEHGLSSENKANRRQMPRAEYFLGRIYLCGIELESSDGIEPEDIPRLQVPTDPHKAAAYLELAYNGGYTHAAYYLGKLHQRGDLHPEHEPDYRQAAAWFTKEESSAYCRFALAGMYERGQGFEADAAKAAEFYRSCLTDGNSYLVSESAYAIAQMQHYGSLPETDMHVLYQKAAGIWLKQEAPEAQIHARLSQMYEHGLGVETSLPKALEHCLEAEKSDPSPRLSYRIAQLMEKSGLPEDAVYRKYGEALDGMLREEADPDAQPDAQRVYRIASMYRYGRGTETDTAKALEWYLKDTENAFCRFGAASLLRYGEGVPADPIRAEALYRSCLNCGGFLSTESAYALAQMQRGGILPETDMQALYASAAKVWLQQKQPEENIRLRLARMFEHGLGVPENRTAAIRYYETCSPAPALYYKLGRLHQQTGSAPALFQIYFEKALNGMLQEEQTAEPDAQRAVRIASMYRYGLGTEVNTTEAFRWYTTAAERGSEYAEIQRQKLAEQVQSAHASRSMNAASQLLSMIGNALRQQILRDQQPGARADRKQRRQERRLKHALGQKEDHEQIYQ